jgi:hypothetical protein
VKEIGCPVCATQLAVRIAHGRKSNKPFIMLACPADGRHFRAFITDQKYVGQVLGDRRGSENPENTQGVGRGVG